MNRDQQKLISNILLLIGTALTIPFGDYFLAMVKSHNNIDLKDNYVSLLLFCCSLMPYSCAFFILDSRIRDELELKENVNV